MSVPGPSAAYIFVHQCSSVAGFRGKLLFETTTTVSCVRVRLAQIEDRQNPEATTQDWSFQAFHLLSERTFQFIPELSHKNGE